jgi:hypothetical protein
MKFNIIMNNVKFWLLCIVMTTNKMKKYWVFVQTIFLFFHWLIFDFKCDENNMLIVNEYIREI